jgi:hypothetical protein
MNGNHRFEDQPGQIKFSIKSAGVNGFSVVSISQKEVNVLGITALSMRHSHNSVESISQKVSNILSITALSMMTLTC